MTIFKACDVRGVFGVDWTLDDAKRIGQSLSAMLERRGESRICVGGDFRRSTQAVKRALIDGLLETGTDVLDVGQLPTPVAYGAATMFDCRNVAVVTASHNPAEYNGVKFMVAGRPAVPELVSELQSGIDSTPSARPIAQVQSRSVLPDYQRWIVERSEQLLAACAANNGGPGRTDASHLGSANANATATDGAVAAEPQPLHVVVDAMGGACTHIAANVLLSTGVTACNLCTEIDPDFTARPPNPSDDANLTSLTQRVSSDGADLGIALDGDGDRVIFVDHLGHIARPEQIAAILIRLCFDQPTVAYDLKCASIVARETTAAGGSALMRPSGYGFIKTTMIDHQADLGVEASGHHFFRALAGGDDGLFTALTLFGMLKQTRRRLADLTALFPWPVITPDLRVPYEGDAKAAVARIAADCGGSISRLDGVRAEYDNGWALARASITEPVITLRFEATDQQALNQIASRFLVAMPDLRARVLEKIHV